MTEKRKWFDPKCRAAPLPQPVRLANTSHVSEQDCCWFFEQLRGARAHEKIHQAFWELACMPPGIRLARNLKKLLDCLANGPADNFMRDAFTEQERYDLIDLQPLKAEVRDIAERLLNVAERYQLFLATKDVFQKAQATRWLPERLQNQDS